AWCFASPGASPSWSKARCCSRVAWTKSGPIRACATYTWASEDTMTERVLELQDLSAGYGETVVLENVSLHLAAGEALAVLGRNGVGKTTLLTTLLGLNTVHGGALRYLGQDFSGWPAHQRARRGLGLVPQEREIFPSLTVQENLTVA